MERGLTGLWEQNFKTTFRASEALPGWSVQLRAWAQAPRHKVANSIRGCCGSCSGLLRLLRIAAPVF